MKESAAITVAMHHLMVWKFAQKVERSRSSQEETTLKHLGGFVANSALVSTGMKAIHKDIFFYHKLYFIFKQRFFSLVSGRFN